MLHINDIIGATIVRIEAYGIYLEHDTYEILVLIPEISWKPVRNINELYRKGETINVKIIGYVDEEDYYKGSIRQLTPEDNPYNDLQDHQDKIFKGVVKTKFTDEITVELENLAWGDIPLNEIHEDIEAGDKILVKVDEVHPEQCELQLKYIGKNS